MDEREPGLVMSMPLTPNPPVNIGSAADVTRPWPTDAPGSDGASGWIKLDAPSSDGWDRIDDVDGADDAGWEQT